MKEIYNKIIERFDLDCEECTIGKKGNNYFFLETSDGENFFVYNGTKNFDYDEFIEVLNSDQRIIIPVMAFQDLEQERQAYWALLKTCKDRKSKRILNKCFSEKFSVYLKDNEPVILEVDNEGINYLEYLSDFKGGGLEGYIYNISFFEIRKLYNVTGEALFDKNVRMGLEKRDAIAEDIRTKFREYLYVYFFEYVNEREKEIEETLLSYLGLDIEQCAIRNPKNFWFYHNGITIFSYGNEKPDRCGNKIRLNPKNVSVINGAQTITNFLLQLEAVEIELEAFVKENLSECKLEIKVILEEALKNIKLKTIIIHGLEKYVLPITHGLNTQIPILGDDILANSPEVFAFNDNLKRYMMKITRKGESGVGIRGYSPQEFAKKYLISTGLPGTSKNLNKNEIQSILTTASNELRKGKDEWTKFFSMIDSVDIWWQREKQKRMNQYDGDIATIVNKYGKYYFEAFLVKCRVEDFDEESIWIYFDRFIEILENQILKVELEAFKKDELFQSILKEMHSIGQNYLLNFDIDTEDLKHYLNNTEYSSYAISSKISKYFRKRDIECDYFRVIKTYGGKMKESFPFASSTFNQLIEWYYNSNSSESKHNFDESKFKEEVLKPFVLLILDMKSDQQKESKRWIIENIHCIKEFSFSNYLESAKFVFEQTQEAFNSGNENDFPKLSDRKDFHVRPKAVNSKDTFEFTNGQEITKRTFWANKKMMENEIFIQLKKQREDKKLPAIKDGMN